MTLELSFRASQISQAEIRTMSIECERVDGINLAQGVCDTEVPHVVSEGAHRAIDRGINSYTRYDGLTHLREAIAGKMDRFNRIKANPATDIVVSAGSTGALYCACLALLNPGDEVVLFEPYYGYHVNTLLAVEAVPRFVTLHPPNWTIDTDKLEEAITPRTKAIIVNTPGNPSGKIFSEKELESISEVACRHDLFVFTDEIYEHFLYDGRKHISPGSLPGMIERTITISGLSKVFSITGWRIGYSVSRADWAKAIGYVNDLVYVCAPAPLQDGAACGMEELGPAFYNDLTQEYQTKRDQLCRSLIAAGLSPTIPQGAYYILADASMLPGATSREKAMSLLRLAGVASVPGEAFYSGAEGNNLLRFCFAKKQDELSEACRRLSQLSYSRKDFQSTTARKAGARG
jgi:aminotransferase